MTEYIIIYYHDNIRPDNKPIKLKWYEEVKHDATIVGKDYFTLHIGDLIIFLTKERILELVSVCNKTIEEKNESLPTIR